MCKRLFSCALALASIATLAQPAQAAGPASFTFSGRGYGHGRGMGQWGAKAIAERGRSYKTILSHYYSGIGLGSLSRQSAIRVHVGTLSSAMIRASSAFDVYEIGGRAIATGVTGTVRVRPVSNGSVVERSDRYQGPYKRLTTTSRHIGFAPRKSMLQVVEPDGGFRGYRGSIAVRRKSTGTVWVIVTCGLEEYLRGVVPREMPSTWPAHALRAQSVAARTYAVRAMQRSRERGLLYDICSSTTCQVFGGSRRRVAAGDPIEELERDSTTSAVTMTKGVVMTYGGDVILAEYSSSSGGYTAPGGTPYLKPRPDSGDSISPYSKWSAKITDDKIEDAYPEAGDVLRIVVMDRNGYGSGGGRVVEVLIDGQTKDLRVEGPAFRRAVGLRSDWFTL